jgi:hypothetical protein
MKVPFVCELHPAAKRAGSLVTSSEGGIEEHWQQQRDVARDPARFAAG